MMSIELYLVMAPNDLSFHNVTSRDANHLQDDDEQNRREILQSQPSKETGAAQILIYCSNGTSSGISFECLQ
jgi:phosphoserine aminotransferase